jgi:hypothetical protein
MRPTLARSATTSQRRARLIQLRLKGVPYEDIAIELGYATEDSDGVRTARKDFTRACRAAAALEQEAADTWRETERQRLDALQAAYWDDAIDGNTKAAEIILKVIADRRKLLGIDAPIQVDATITEVTQQDIALQEMIAEAKARNAVRMQELQANADGDTE